MKLFWKIFLAFWITTIVMVLTSVWLTTIIGKARITTVAQAVIATAAEDIAAKVVDSGIGIELNETIKQHIRKGVRVEITNERGNTVRGTRIKQATLIERFAEVVTSAEKVQINVQAPDGNAYTIRARPSRNDARRLVFRYQWIRFILMLLVSGIICYVMARYLFRPLRELSSTSKMIADGELSARVSKKVCARSDELGGLGRDYNGMADRLVSEIETQTQLLRDVSHELRSPLTRLQVALGLIDREAASSNIKYIERIDTEASRLEAMISRVLSLVRMDASSAEFEPKPVDLVDIVNRVASDALFEAKGVGKQIKPSLASPIVTTGDAELLQSAIENVVRNALRYTPPEVPVEIQITREPGDIAEINVLDGGLGVPESEIGRLFDSFYRVSRSRDRKSGGVGLGLSITQRAIEIHDGEVFAANRIEGGLQVTLRVPVGRVDGVMHDIDHGSMKPGMLSKYESSEVTADSADEYHRLEIPTR